MSAALGNGGGHRHPAGVPPGRVMRPRVRRWPSPSAGRACPVPGFGAGRTPRAGGVRGADRGARKTDRRGDAAHPTGSPPEREAAARLRLRIGRFPHAGVPRNGKSRKKSRSGQRGCGFCRTVFPAAQAPGNHACGLSSPAGNMSRTPLRSENPIFRNGNARTVRFFLQLAGQLGAQFRERARGPGQPAGGARPVGLRPHTACDLGAAARQRARQTPAHASTRPGTCACLPPMWSSPHGPAPSPPRHRRPPAQRRLNTSTSPPANLNGAFK